MGNLKTTKICSDYLTNKLNEYNRVRQEIEKKILYEELVKLNDRDKEIMMMRYGLCGRKERTQKRKKKLRKHH